MKQTSPAASGLVALACAAALAACSQPPAQKAPTNRLVPAYSEDTGKLTELKYDRNNDGKIDTWATMDGSRVVRIEIDEDGDGKPDRWEYYKPGNAPGVPGVLERVETATRHDGRVSRREFLENGRLVRIEEDTDGDGVVDKWETYRDGALAVLELDTLHRGKPDRRLIYSLSGAVERIEADPDGSGQFRVVPNGR